MKQKNKNRLNKYILNAYLRVTKDTTIFALLYHHFFKKEFYGKSPPALDMARCTFQASTDIVTTDTALNEGLIHHHGQNA